jgi:hypothetical protein
MMVGMRYGWWERGEGSQATDTYLTAPASLHLAYASHSLLLKKWDLCLFLGI